jgi:hypothetical protein
VQKRVSAAVRTKPLASHMPATPPRNIKPMPASRRGGRFALRA